MQTAETKVVEIAKFAAMLSDADQSALLKALRKQILLAQAERLDSAVKLNDISMDEILEIISHVRKAQHGKPTA